MVWMLPLLRANLPENHSEKFSVGIAPCLETAPGPVYFLALDHGKDYLRGEGPVPVLLVDVLVTDRSAQFNHPFEKFHSTCVD